MPPRYAYWTIIADGLPTAFRAAERDELLPTFARIKHKHPDAEMKWFARGRLWDSPESARSANRPPSGPSERSRLAGPSRGRDWRPGGEHRDPRQKYQDAKKARNVEERKRKFERRQRFESKGKLASAPPRPDRPSGPGGARDSRGVQKKFFPRNQGSSEPPTRPRPAGPSGEARPPRFEGKGKPAFAKPKPDRPWGPGGARGPRGFQKTFFPRNQGTEEPARPPRPPGPSREPRPREGNEPTPPPRPSEPVVPPPGPPERGRRDRRDPRRDTGKRRPR